jgi:anti-sigma regulatory factor (Ser/Thr protein kinase)
MKGTLLYSSALRTAFENVDSARARIDEILRDVFPDEGSVSFRGDFLLAASEAMNNAVEHSGAETMEIKLFINNDNAVLRLSTIAKKFNPLNNISMPDLDNACGLPEGGFGLAIIHELMDAVNYRYSKGKNILTLSKKLVK